LPPNHHCSCPSPHQHDSVFLSVRVAADCVLHCSPHVHRCTAGKPTEWTLHHENCDAAAGIEHLRQHQQAPANIKYVCQPRFTDVNIRDLRIGNRKFPLESNRWLQFESNQRIVVYSFNVTFLLIAIEEFCYFEGILA